MIQNKSNPQLHIKQLSSDDAEKLKMRRRI
jgi:hypothetical protein